MGFFRQHERLRVPQFWKGEERAFVVQLETLLDKLFNLKTSDQDLTPEFLSSIFRTTAKVVNNGDDCNDCNEPGLYYITENVEHSPTKYAGMIVINSGIGRDWYQIIYNKNGIWVRGYSGNPPNWTEWRKARHSYVPGETVTINSEIRAMGFGWVTSNAAQIDMCIPMPMDVPDGSVTLTSLKAVIRGANGYVDIFDWDTWQTEKIGTSGYTFSAWGRGGQLRLMILKSSALSNATNNTPVTVDILGMYFTVPA